jgi:hypothetical protein
MVTVLGLLDPEYEGTTTTSESVANWLHIDRASYPTRL